MTTYDDECCDNSVVNDVDRGDNNVPAYTIVKITLVTIHVQYGYSLLSYFY